MKSVSSVLLDKIREYEWKRVKRSVRIPVYVSVHFHVEELVHNNTWSRIGFVAFHSVVDCIGEKANEVYLFYNSK